MTDLPPADLHDREPGPAIAIGSPSHGGEAPAAPRHVTAETVALPKHATAETVALPRHVTAETVTLPKHVTAETVTSVRHWTDRLFSFTLTRGQGLRFENGQFAMIGLMVDGKPLLRAYSMASANYEEQLEFLSIRVPDGPLTSRLGRIRVGDQVLVGRKPTGTLLLDNLLPGRNCYFLSTGTGLAPFLSLTKDPAVYDRFERVVVVHGVRHANELAFADRFERELAEDELLSELVAGKLIYYPTVTREPFRNQGRVTDLMRSGKLFADIGLPRLDPAVDRVMICGSEAMLADTKAMLREDGLSEGSSAEPGSFVIEKAFAER